MQKTGRNLLALLMAVILVLSLTACGTQQPQTAAAPAETGEAAAQAQTGEEKEEEKTEETGQEEAAQEEAPVEKNGDIYILFTSDVHCGVDQGFGYAGLQQVRDTLEKSGYETILVDDGDSIQGEAIGTLSRGEDMIGLMNEVGYDVAIPGNHEFDYGTDRFLELAEKADFPYVSCNFTYLDQPVFEPYVIKEAAGKKIAFVGVTTPLTIRSSTPAYFQNEEGEYVYGFMEDDTGEKVCQALQSAVDAARAEGADYVYVMAHMGNIEAAKPWTYTELIARTNGIDVFLDGHSHDTDQVIMKNKDGEDVPRSAVGTKMSCIGYSHISADGSITETGILSWPNKDSVPALLNIQNDMRDKVDLAMDKLREELNQTVAVTEVELTISDPEAKDASGNPVRMVRRAETNLGDLCADALLDQSGADIALENGGSIRVSIDKGDITYGDIIAVHPFGNMLCVVEAKGQQILDALEWGARAIPEETGGFLHAAGLTYEIDSSIDTPCRADDKAMLAGIEGPRRVRNVMVGDEPLDPEKTYTVAGSNYVLLDKGDGNTAFEGAVLLQDNVKIDNQVLIDYITGTLGGKVGEEYADPYGQGRITILE